jgi:hypothetical protein
MIFDVEGDYNMVYGRTININSNVERISVHKKINFERQIIQANVHDKKTPSDL